MIQFDDFLETTTHISAAQEGMMKYGSQTVPVLFYPNGLWRDWSWPGAVNYLCAWCPNMKTLTTITTLLYYL